jgi:hypothetical protein
MYSYVHAQTHLHGADSSLISSHSLNEETPCILYNSKVHHRNYKRPPVNFNVIHLKLSHILTHCFLNVRTYIIISLFYLRLALGNVLFPSGFPANMFLITMRATCPAHPTLRD